MPTGPVNPLDEQPDVLVVGGGIVGLFCAYYLRQAGHSVTVLERATVADRLASSSGNTGFVGIGSTPLAGPGTIVHGLRSLLRPDDRLALQPTLDPDRLRWLLRLRRAGRAEEVSRVSAVMLELKRRSLQLLGELGESTGPRAGFSQTGMLQAYRSASSFEQACRAVPVAVAAGIPLRVVAADELRELEPGCRFAIAGALHNEAGGFLHAPDFLHSLTAVLAGLGVQVIEQRAVRHFEVAGNRITGAVTSDAVWRPSEVVLATGSWSRELARTLDLRLPVQPVRGYAVTLDRPANAPRLPVHLVQGTVALRVLGDRLRLAGDLSLAGTDRSIARRRVQRLIRTVREHLPGLTFQGQPEVWAGLRPCTPDSLPLLGRVDGWDNLSIATGHGHNGMGLAPVTGQLLAQLLDGKPTAMDASPLRVDRYPTGTAGRG